MKVSTRTLTFSMFISLIMLTIFMLVSSGANAGVEKRSNFEAKSSEYITLAKGQPYVPPPKCRCECLQA